MSLKKCCACGCNYVMHFEPHLVSVTSVGVRQLCLRRIGVHSQKSLKTAVLADTLKPDSNH